MILINSSLIFVLLLVGGLVGAVFTWFAIMGTHEDYVEMPADLEGLSESQNQFKQDYCNKILSIICNMYRVEDNEISMKDYAVDLNCIFMEMSFRDVSFTMTLDFGNGKYAITAYKFIEGNKVIRHHKQFKMDLSNGVNYKEVIEFVDEFSKKTNRVKRVTYQDFITDIADIANDPAVANFTDEQKEDLLYEAAARMANVLSSRRLRRNGDLVAAYTVLMTHLVGCGRTEGFIKYLQHMLLEEVEETEEETKEEVKEEV